MKATPHKVGLPDSVLDHAARYGTRFRTQSHPIHPAEDAEALRKRFCTALPEVSRDPRAVLDDLIAAAESGLVGNTDGNFFAWVMGGSDITGVAADWLTSVWGQNAGIYQTAPAAAIAEEAVESYLLDLLDLSRQSSVGLVTGATMAGFVGLAAARQQVLARVGFDLDKFGLQSAPLIRIFLCEDSHICNYTALRYLGFGQPNLVRIPANEQGVMQVPALKQALSDNTGPAIILGQAGHINTGGFDDFSVLADLAEEHNAWLHVDGAFGLWLRMLPEKSHLTAGLDRADSWSVDGHKWLQLPYDCGFAILRDRTAHRQAMDISASYLNQSPGDGRNPTEYNPELSRRARGFAAWAVMQAKGREGIRTLIRDQCRFAEALAGILSATPGIRVLNRVDANQIVLSCIDPLTGQTSPAQTQALADRLNAGGEVFVRTTVWQGETRLRLSIISGTTSSADIEKLCTQITRELVALQG